MNFNVFKAIATRAYNNIADDSYTLDEVLKVFEYYFKTYEYELHRPHPHIKSTQIERIILKMPYLDEDGEMNIDSECYPDIIDQHFKTEYQCDYNINHFFSGDIRLLRFYEACY